jgi:hypothetical protein
MNISRIRQTMEEEGVLFSFSGIISQSLTEFMVETASKQFSDEGHNKTMIQTLFLIAIEELQNVMSYSKQKMVISGNRYTSPGILVVGFDDKKQKYYVASSNEIEEIETEQYSKSMQQMQVEVMLNPVKSVLRLLVWLQLCNASYQMQK